MALARHFCVTLPVVVSTIHTGGVIPEAYGMLSYWDQPAPNPTSLIWQATAMHMSMKRQYQKEGRIPW